MKLRFALKMHTGGHLRIHKSTESSLFAPSLSAPLFPEGWGLDTFFLDVKRSLSTTVIISLVLCGALMKSCVG